MNGESTFFFQKDVLHEHLFEGFESFLKESLCEIHDGKDYLDGKLFEFHRTGIITTTSAMHQGLHCDDQMVYTIDGFECFIYHLPLDPEGLHIRVAYIEKSEDDGSVIELREKMIHVPFGCMVFFSPNLIHGGHYGSPGSLRMHGIISKEKWHGSELLKLHDCVHKKFPEIEDEVKIENVSAIKLEDVCPFCFKSIVFKGFELHNKRCTLTEKMKNAKFNVTQYLSALLKAYPTALFEKTVMMRTVDKGKNYNSLIFNEKYDTTEVEYNKKK